MFGFRGALARPLTTATAAMLAVAAVALTIVVTSRPATAAPAVAKPKPQPAAWRVLDPTSPTGRIVAVLGGHLSGGPAGVQHVAVAATPKPKVGCLSSAAVRAGHGLVVRAVDWGRGTVTLRLTSPTCRGVQLAAGGAQYAFEVGSHTEGTARRPNLPRFPQDRAAYTSWQSIAGAARDVRVRIPAVRNQCSQNDVGVRTQGSVAVWPAKMPHLGITQPQGIAYYVGNGRGCVVAPSVKAEAHCPTTCKGVTTVTLSAATASPYGTTTVVWRDLATGRPVATVRVTASRSARVTVPLADGSRVQPFWSHQLGASTPAAPASGVIEVRCPPAPELQLQVRCLCASLDGTFTDNNQTRYVHVIVIRAAGRTLRADVAAGATGRLTATWPRGTTVTVLVQSQLGGRNVGPVHVEHVTI